VHSQPAGYGPEEEDGRSERSEEVAAKPNLKSCLAERMGKRAGGVATEVASGIISTLSRPERPASDR